VLSSIGTWINTKILLEEIETIKKHLQIPEEGTNDFRKSTKSIDDNDDIKPNQQ
jgi:hypothetical protein